MSRSPPPSPAFICLLQAKAKPNPDYVLDALAHSPFHVLSCTVSCGAWLTPIFALCLCAYVPMCLCAYVCTVPCGPWLTPIFALCLFAYVPMCLCA